MIRRLFVSLLLLAFAGLILLAYLQNDIVGVGTHAVLVGFAAFAAIAGGVGLVGLMRAPAAAAQRAELSRPLPIVVAGWRGTLTGTGTGASVGPDGSECDYDSAGGFAADGEFAPEWWREFVASGPDKAAFGAVAGRPALFGPDGRVTLLRDGRAETHVELDAAWAALIDERGAAPAGPGEIDLFGIVYRVGRDGGLTPRDGGSPARSTLAALFDDQDKLALRRRFTPAARSDWAFAVSDGRLLRVAPDGRAEILIEGEVVQRPTLLAAVTTP